MPAKKKQTSLIDSIVSPKGIAILLVVLVLLSLGIYGYTRRTTYLSKLSPTPTTKPTPTPITLRPDDGVKGTYGISQGKHVGPTISQIVFDPLDARKGKNLAITVKIMDTTPVSKVTGVLTTDNGTQNIVFAKNSGTDIEGTWQGQIVLDDSVFYTYILKVTATSEKGTNTVGTAPRSR